MKNFKIAVATAALALASGYASAAVTGAANEATDGITASYTLAKILSINVTTNITMPTLVNNATAAVAGGPAAMNATVTLHTNGSVAYSTGSNPATAAANASNGTMGSVGEFTVSGENGYHFDVSIGSITGGDTGVTLSNLTFSDDSGASDNTSFQLNSTPSTINVGATLTATSSAAATTASTTPTDFAFNITVTYAGV